VILKDSFIFRILFEGGKGKILYTGTTIYDILLAGGSCWIS